MKKRGYTILELAVSISLIGIILSISIPIFSRENIEFEKSVFQIKNDIRTVGISSINKYSSYKISFNRNYYSIYRGMKREKKVYLGKNIFMRATDNAIWYKNMARSGAPQKGFSVYVVDKKLKKAERITVMLGSGRVHSYKENYSNINGEEY